jgi:hypothetical protein
MQGVETFLISEFSHQFNLQNKPKAFTNCKTLSFKAKVLSFILHLFIAFLQRQKILIKSLANF